MNIYIILRLSVNTKNKYTFKILNQYFQEFLKDFKSFCQKKIPTLVRILFVYFSKKFF